MATTSLLEIQKAIRTKLLSNSTLMGRVKGIFDNVPDTRSFPYITIGEALELKFNTFGRDGKEVLHTLHIWSEYNGFKEVLEIMDIVDSELDGVNLSVDGFDLVLIHFEDKITMRDIDHRLAHIVARYRVIVQHN